MIEMQLYQHKDFFERIFNYMATTYTQNYKAETVKSIISIVVTNFTVFPEFQEARVEIGERKGQVMICFKMNLPMEEIEVFRKEMES
jgi:ATP-dependent DNA helicase recQ